MKRIILVLCLLCLSTAGMAQLKVTEHTLSNGLRVWLNEDHSQPKVIGAVVVNAGAKDSPGTGIAHYLEHIMFKGTERIGTTDWAKEKVILDSISAQYDLLAQTILNADRERIQMEINALSIRAAQYAIPNEFDKLISRSGGSGLNAYTSPDQTVYHNRFAPAYIAQWAEVASERFLKPVWRMFQGELETVYEEKNMYANNFAYLALERAQERFFAPHPYGYPVIGLSASLKNPRLSEMTAFYNKYYVAGNMGLILSGDFDAQKVLPILEQTFSRIPAGTVAAVDAPAPPSFQGSEKFKIKIPFPLIKGCVIGWRGAVDGSFDELVLEVAGKMLCNDNQTGLLDERTMAGDVLGALALSEGMKDAGILGVGAIAKLPFGSAKKTEGYLRAAVERLRKGDFSDALFESVKLEALRQKEGRLEDMDGRIYVLANCFTLGLTFEEELRQLEQLKNLTREQLAAAVDRYFTGDCLVVTKKMGSYKREKVTKPGFAPIVPPNKEAKSAYALELEKQPQPESKPRLLDFERDVRTEQLSPLVTLYSRANPVNGIFSLDIVYRRGQRDDPNLKQVAEYLSYLGMDSLSQNEFRNELQRLGARLDFESTRTTFTVSVRGFDTNLEPTLSLASRFLRGVKPDKKQLKKVVDSERIDRKGFDKSADALSGALQEWVLYGQRSTYLSGNSMARIKKLTGEELVASFQKALTAECDVHYCGNAAPQVLADAVRGFVQIDRVTLAGDPLTYRDQQPYDGPAVFFVDMPKATQAIVRAYIPSVANPEERQRNQAAFFNAYMGGDMSSVLFQEIREFRSFAYGVRGQYSLPTPREKEKPGTYLAWMSTQNDKTADAMGVMDSLLRTPPLKEERLPDVRQLMRNKANNAYPDMRSLSTTIASMRRQGYTADPDASLLAALPGMSTDDIADFHRRNLAGRPVVWMVVGDAKKIDMKALEAFGPVKKLKADELYK